MTASGELHYRQPLAESEKSSYKRILPASLAARAEASICLIRLHPLREMKIPIKIKPLRKTLNIGINLLRLMYGSPLP
jgi:hypothetical protein